MIRVALPKGRLGEKVYDMFKSAGYGVSGIEDGGRKLIFEDKKKNICYFWVKPSDVAIYVERGAADIGVAGKDILLESRADVFELLDLGVGKCRMSVAAKADFKYPKFTDTLRVATKFENIASDFYRSRFQNVDIIHLNGSIELAPLLGLSDVIVDIVESGNTLKENKLVEIESIFQISARLIANKAYYRFNKDEINKIKLMIEKLVENK